MLENDLRIKFKPDDSQDDARGRFAGKKFDVPVLILYSDYHGEIYV